MPHSPTDEQVAVLDLARTTNTNLMLNAYAGCGKTSTLEMIEHAVSTKPILYLVFNTRNAKEAEKRMLSTTTVRTFNSLGHRVWAKTQGKNLTLQPKKVPDILREIIKSVKRKDAQGPMWDSFWEVVNGVAMAKALGYVPDGKYPQAKRLCTQSELHRHLDETPDDLTSDLIDTVLAESIRQAYDGVIDYNDQLFMPSLFNCSLPRFPLVKVDEFQDLSPVNHALLGKLARDRLIGVGDPWQNIYGFRGAKQGGMAEAQAKWAMKACDLSISFRCPQAIVEAARWRVPHFKWIKDGGHYEQLVSLTGNDIPDDSAIICRNNAPLFRAAMCLLGIGRSVSVVGSDIGPKLIAIMRKLGDESLSRASTVAAIDAWLEAKLEAGSTTAGDLAECMKVFASHGTTLGSAISYAEHLFAQKGSIKLMTGHKAKGLEFETVYFLDPWLVRKDPTNEQDLNLDYVIQTRSMSHCYEIDSRRIEW